MIEPTRDRNGRYAVVRHPGAGLWFLHLFLNAPNIARALGIGLLVGLVFGMLHPGR